jgi:predicted kinase
VRPGRPDVRPADSAADRADLARPDARDRLDDLRERLGRLPPGHPSSPYETDGTRRDSFSPARELDASDESPRADVCSAADPADSPPGEPRSGPDTAPADRVSPLTDAEWGEHVTDVRDGLTEAAADGLVTRGRFTIDRAGKIWSAERDAVHDSIIEDICGRAEGIPCERQAIIAGGLGGAGKSTVLGKHAGIDLTRYLTINPDDVKEEMGRRGLIPDVAGLSPMEASDLVHAESSHIAKRIARRALADGRNVIWDITMSRQDSTEERIDDLHDAGYSVTGIFVDIAVEASVRRAESRHRSGHEEYRAGIGLGAGTCRPSSSVPRPTTSGAARIGRRSRRSGTGSTSGPATTTPWTGGRRSWPGPASPT